MMYFVCTITPICSNKLDVLNEKVLEFPFECEVGKKWEIYYDDKTFITSPVVRKIKVTSNKEECYVDKIVNYKGIPDSINSIEITFDECIMFLFCIGSWETTN